MNQPPTFARYIDHTLLKPEASAADIERLCREALKYHFATAFVNPCWVQRAAELLRGSDVKVGVAIGFPLGAHTTASKVFQTEEAIRLGAQEPDMVINIGAVKSGDWELVMEDIRAVVIAARPYGVKVILETCLLTDEEKIRAALVARDAGAAFVKTSTGFSTGGATIEDVRLLRRVVGPELGLKASGGIRDYEFARALIAAGATRIGTSAGPKIIEEYLEKEKQQ